MPNSRAAAVEGESTRLCMRFTTSGALYDPFSLEDVNLYSEDPTANPSAVAIATITPTNLSTGYWYVDYTFNTPGIYFDKWRYIPEDGDNTSETVENVVVNTLPTSVESDWSLLATWEAALNTVNQDIADLAGRVDMKDGSLTLSYSKNMKELRKWRREINMEILRRTSLAGGAKLATRMERDGMDSSSGA